MSQDILFIPSFPFDDQYVDHIICQLRRHDPFVVLGIDDNCKKYSIFHLNYSKDILGKKFIAHLDRNIVSYCYQFLRREMRNIGQQQMALSCLIYLNMFSVEYELSQMMLEAHHSRSGSHGVHTEIAFWNLLDELLKSSDIRYALELIGEGKNRLPDTYVTRMQTPELDDSDLEPGMAWHSAYIHLLKMAEIQKNRSFGVDAVVDYLDWVVEWHKFDVAAVYFAVIFFSENQAHGRIYDTQRRIQNLSWDLAHIGNWFRESKWHIEAEGPVDILVAHDKRLKELAFILSRSVRNRPDSLAELDRLIAKYNTLQSRPALLNAFASFEERLKDPSRPRNTFNDVRMKKRCISAFEESLFGGARSS